MTGITLALLLLSPFFAATASAQTLDMPDTGEQRERFEMVLPARGMSMGQVTERFGEPRRRYEPVGEPPITRWVYDEYTVYFEGRYVIQSVLNRDVRQ